MAKLADVMFVLDTTGSMRNAIEAVKNVIGQLADIYSEASIETRLGIIQFRDRVLTHGQDEGTNRTLERAQFDEGDFTQYQMNSVTSWRSTKQRAEARFLSLPWMLWLTRLNPRGGKKPPESSSTSRMLRRGSLITG